MTTTTLQLVRRPATVTVTAPEASPAVVALQRSRLSRTLAEVAAAIVAREQGRGGRVNLEERHVWRHSSADEGARVCVECEETVAEGDHEPRGAIVSLNGAPYEWHPAIFFVDGERVVTIPESMTSDAFMAFLAEQVKR